MLLILISGPNVVWQMTLAGNIRHNDVSKTVLDDILQNSSVIQAIPALKELNLTKYKEELLSSTSTLNRDHYTAMLIGSSVFLILVPFVCFCFSRQAVSGQGTGRMACICCIEGICGCNTFFLVFLPLLLISAVCWHLKNDSTFLNCAEIVPWLEKTVTDGIVLVVNQQVPPKVVDVTALTLTAAPTFSGVLQEIFTAAGMTADFKTSYLDAVGQSMDMTKVNTLAQGWLTAFKAQHPGALPTETVPLADVTTSFLNFMFEYTTTEQMTFCQTQVSKIYQNVGQLSIMFSVMALAAGCKAFACCFGACEARAARNAFSKELVGPAYASGEAEQLLSTKPSAPLGAMGEPPARKGYFEACCTNHCGRK